MKNSPQIAIGGELPPIHWITPKNRHKTYAELVLEGVIKPAIRLENWVDISALPADFAIVIGTPKLVALNRLIPTQPSVTLAGVVHYLNRKRYTDKDGQLACGIQFADSPNVYLINGHHRLEASRRAGRKFLRVTVESYPFSLSEALKGH